MFDKVKIKVNHFECLALIRVLLGMHFTQQYNEKLKMFVLSQVVQKLRAKSITWSGIDADKTKVVQFTMAESAVIALLFTEKISPRDLSSFELSILTKVVAQCDKSITNNTNFYDYKKGRPHHEIPGRALQDEPGHFPQEYSANQA